MLSAINSNQQHLTGAIKPDHGKYSLQIPKIGCKTALLGIFAILALSSLPVASAGPTAYWGCVQTCLQSMGPGWHSAIICPTICAPLLAVPGG